MGMSKAKHQSEVEYWDEVRSLATDKLDRALMAAREDGVSYTELGKWLRQSNSAVRQRASRHGWDRGGSSGDE